MHSSEIPVLNTYLQIIFQKYSTLFICNIIRGDGSHNNNFTDSDLTHPYTQTKYTNPSGNKKINA